MRTDSDVAVDCADRLQLTLDLDDRDIAVKIVDGVALLVGIVRSDQERAQAQQVVKKVHGVRGLTNCLSVCPQSPSAPSDPEITREAVAAMRHQYPAQADQLQVMVQSGRIALEGELDWHYQRDVIEAVVRSLRGVRLVTNRIRVREVPSRDDRLTGVHGNG
jgi:osmotically-inducible protein OsmY